MTAVWLHYDQAALDAQYDQRTLVPDAAAYMARWRAWSDAWRETVPPRVVAYGPGPDEAFDLFPGNDPAAPAHLHLHGGAWRMLSRHDASFVACGLAPGASRIAVADFGLAPVTPLATIAAQVRAAARRLIADLGPITVSGHSSGAHLASLLLATPDIVPRIVAVTLASGPYDLEPVRLSARNAYLGLDKATARALSAASGLASPLPRMLVAWGTEELEEFRRQGAEMAAALDRAGAQTTAADYPLNHFALYDAFHDPASPLMAAAQALVRQDDPVQQGKDTP